MMAFTHLLVVLLVATATVTQAASARKRRSISPEVDDFYPHKQPSAAADARDDLHSNCVPGENCKAPNCRCWGDRSIPGGLSQYVTPQIILLTFGNSVNSFTTENSLDVLQNITNPNGCPALGTFFIEEVHTDPEIVKELYQAGHEIALSTMNDTIPKTDEEWVDNIRRVKERVLESGIPEYAIRGFRSAQLFAGGDDAIDALKKLNLQYDSTCVNRQYVSKNNTLWPYTYDYPARAPQCSIGRTPTKSHNGTWQFLMPIFKWGDNFCSTVSACAPYLKRNTTNDVYDFLLENFLRHYMGNKAPFNLYLDPLWLTYDHQREGTKRFFDFLNILTDVWVVTFQQALDWMRSPVDKAMALKYPPWMCGNKQRPRTRIPRRR